ncbi:3-deoxy-D-manno-octulosonic acid transferase [Caldimonas tepidiphila]|uniref:3-deoxy-D-manno-octulosonic acid transferase n=1 Tax=Caldimonas tepidiphila TaxID=2315841 RepID=UPI000E5A4364|nr:3-deoxy-D-manno-octulosonic acid transferase [Caldimonas tepidiphila]
MPPLSSRIARLAYSGLLRGLLPAYLLKLWWRGRHEPLYRHAVGERLGHYADDEAPQHGWVWVHAVSLGETRAAATLVEALRAQQPGMRLLLTHGTATGREAGAALLRPGDEQVWLPYDTPGVVQRFFRRFHPRVGLLMETEIWPNLLLGARAQGVPMVLVNARLSQKSLRQGQRLDAVLRPAVESLSLALAQTEEDARRLREAGAREVRVCGNLKFDMNPAPALLARGRAWRAAARRPVVLAASTREGEEPALLAAWREALDAAALPQAPRLVLVPRHPQRFDEVAQAVRAAGFTLARRSDWGEGPPADESDVWLGDSMGEMPAWYAAADVALLGGSFAPLGGQNLIEAAACGCPVLMGPHTFNFAQAAELSLAAGASLRCRGWSDAVAEALALCAARRGQADAMRGAALEFARAHRGAAERMAQAIHALLKG